MSYFSSACLSFLYIQFMQCCQCKQFIDFARNVHLNVQFYMHSISSQNRLLFIINMKEERVLTEIFII